jgi:hypothetical protein
MSPDPPIVLKKSFSPDGRKFLGPLMRFARGDEGPEPEVRKASAGSMGRNPILGTALNSTKVAA